MSSEPRRRPTHRKGRPTLTRASVGEAALDFLGRHEPENLTMRSLAAELGVSPRALYNYVADRRDLITVAAEIFESRWTPAALDAAQWHEDLRAFCRDLRAHYRRHPGMTTLALRENITGARHPVMLRNVDALLGLFLQIGLDLQDAYRACMETFRLVAGFVELQDSFHDRPPAYLNPSDLQDTPPPWLHDQENLPHLARLGEMEADSPDTLFEFSLDLLTDGIAARIRSSRDQHGDSAAAHYR